LTTRHLKLTGDGNTTLSLYDQANNNGLNGAHARGLPIVLRRSALLRLDRLLLGAYSVLWVLPATAAPAGFDPPYGAVIFMKSP
jgi:hypothetical protein